MNKATVMKEVSSIRRWRRICLDDLPLEVLSEVASYLDFPDILSFQQTSKKLQGSTDAHIVWLTLAKKYSAQHFHLYRPETGSFADLKTSEVRTWIRRRLIVDQIWRTRRARPHFRTIQGNEEIATLKLVPGTRWLLVGCKDGSVDYLDLDSKCLKWASLTPPSNTDGDVSEGVRDLEVHVDEGAPRLEFRLVVHVTDNNDEGLGRLHMWRVKLEGDEDSLAAEQLNSIPYGYAFMNSFALGRRLIVCAMSSLVGPSWIEVIWWKQCSVTSDLRTRFFTGCEQIDKIYLLGDDKILCINRDGVVKLYALPEPNHANEYVHISLLQSEYLPRHSPIWTHSLSGRTWHYSFPVRYSGTLYRLVVSTSNGIWGLILPTTKGNVPSVVRLSNVSDRWDKCIPGIRKAYAFRGEDGTLIRIGYNWDDGGGVPTIRYFRGKRKGDTPPGRSMAFDEEVGRFVYFDNSGVVVVDYFHRFNADSHVL